MCGVRSAARWRAHTLLGIQKFLEPNLQPPTSVDEAPACRTVSAAQVLLARFCACHDSLTNAQPAGPRDSPHQRPARP